MRTRVSISLACSLLLACVQTNATVLNPSVKYPATCPDGVEIFRTADRVGKDYQEVAVLYSKGESGYTTEADMMNSMRKKAANVGANGVILTNINEPLPGTKIIGAVLKTGTERKGASVAIYIPADSARVAATCFKSLRAVEDRAGVAVKNSPSSTTVATVRESVTANGGRTQPATTQPASPAHNGVPVSRSAPSATSDTSANKLDDAAAQPGRDTSAAELVTTRSSPAFSAQRTPPSIAVPKHAPATSRPRTGATAFHAAHESSLPRSAGTRTTPELLEDREFRLAFDDVERLHIALDCQEVRPALLRIATGPGFGTASSTDYNLERLYDAYQALSYHSRQTVIELWKDGAKIGEVTPSGVLVGPTYSAPR